MATKVCRTCGFADCPGATTGNCPRWPAREAISYTGRHRTVCPACQGTTRNPADQPCVRCAGTGQPDFRVVR